MTIASEPSAYSVESLREAFDRSVGEGDELDAGELQRALGLSSEYMARRLLDLFDLDGSGRVKRFEFYAAFERLVSGTRRDKLLFLFRLHDDDADGRITHVELDRMVNLGLVENRLCVERDLTARMVDTLFEHANANRDGHISFEEFAAVFERFPAVLEQVTSSEAVWATVKGSGSRGALGSAGSSPRRVAYWLENHGLEAAFLAVYALANMALFIEAFLRYRAADAHVLAQVARGGGACLNFNGALILLPMLRHTITWLRKGRLGHVIPLDESVGFHKLVGIVMFGFSVVHTLAHLANYLRTGDGFFAQLVGTRAGVTGLILMIALAVMVWFSRDRVRRKGRFELFHISHLLYWIWFPIALFHGPVFWIWVTVPLLGYLGERVHRLVHRSSPAPSRSVCQLVSEVTRLDIQKPEGWSHRAGDYVFLRIPEVARTEWHPFTISSAPEQAGSFTVHVRTLGNWTRRLYQLAGSRGAAAAPLAPLDVHIDGPYGTPSAHIFESKYAILIGAGIGVTPFAAILQSILLRRRAGDRSSCLEKVHFIWLNRDQYAFEWFVELLGQLEQEDTEGLLDIHIYMTAGKDDLKSTALILARELVYARSREDLVTGLKARTKMGRPDWPELMRSIAGDHAPEPVDAYCCGPRGLVRALEPLATELGIRLRHEVF
jgi:predicted ferric reductase/Ca2+-binding EF-hand superfamily protein